MVACSVVVENTNVISGVPQGSVLGPILFILFINDIESVCKSCVKLKLFADDLKLGSVVEVANDRNSVALQQSLDKIYSWANAWQLCINVNKTYVLTLSNKAYSSSCRSYFINHIDLPYCNPISDLGIFIDRSLTFKNHIILLLSHFNDAAFFFVGLSVETSHL